MSVSERCEAIRRQAGVIRGHLTELRGVVPGDELMEAQMHLLSLTLEVNQAEARQHKPTTDATSRVLRDGKKLAANDID